MVKKINSKKVVLVVLPLVMSLGILAVVGYFIYQETANYYHASKEIFTMEDPKEDDYGPGAYVYPTDSIFDPKMGHFDLIKFTVSKQEDLYYFDLKMGLVTNPWGAAEGFSHPVGQIYIANGSDNGQIDTFREGAHVNFSPQKPWTSLIKVVSFGKTAVYSAGDYQTSEGKSKGVEAKLLSDKETIRVTVPKEYILGDPWDWSYYVLVGSQDGSGPDNYRPVLSQPSRWNFGGGSNTRYHSNVIDILAPATGLHSQEEMLKNFSVEKGRYAVLHPVGPSGRELSTWEQFLEYMEKVFVNHSIEL